MSFKFASQGVSLCCAAVEITKTSQGTRGFFGAEFLGFGSSFLKYKKFFKLGARKFFFSKYKKPFKSGFFSFFELGELLPEMEEKFARNEKWARKLHSQKYKKVPFLEI